MGRYIGTSAPPLRSPVHLGTEVHILVVASISVARSPGHMMYWASAYLENKFGVVGKTDN